MTNPNYRFEPSNRCMEERQFERGIYIYIDAYRWKDCGMHIYICLYIGLTIYYSNKMGDNRMIVSEEKLKNYIHSLYMSNNNWRFEGFTKVEIVFSANGFSIPELDQIKQVLDEIGAKYVVTVKPGGSVLYIEITLYFY